MLGILVTLKNFNSTPKNVGHSGKIPMIPPKKTQKQPCNLGIKKIPVDNFGKIIEVKNRFHCCPKSQATWKKCSEIF